MFISSDSVGDWPRCTVYLKHNLSPKTLKKNVKVYDAFIKACGDKTLAIKALSYGEYPQVTIIKENKLISKKDPSDKTGKTILTMCGNNPPAYFNQNGGSIIVAGIRAIPLEQCVAAGDIVNNKRRFECTVLHELVHYVRSAAGLNDFDWSFGEYPMEPGEQFELWAYGKRTCDADELADAVSSVF